MKTEMSEKELRKLNEFIAEKVMGWKGRVRPPDTAYPELRYWSKGDGFEILQRQFRPTTDPAAAMQVLEKCAEKTAISMKGEPALYGWDVQTEDGKICVTANTLPLAIAKFSKELFK